MRVDLEGRVALVTGAARGIGRVIADLLAENGARVVYTDRDACAAPDGHLALRLDVTRPAEIDSAVAAVLQRFGRLDILINNAGIGLAERAGIGQASSEAWDQVLGVNLTGVFRMGRAAAAPMIAQRSGRIVNIASVVGLVALRQQGAYAAAKAGVVNLTRSMALELAGHDILVNAVAPGSTETEVWRDWARDPGIDERGLYARLLSHIPLGRPAQPREIGNAVLFLVAPESSYVTGHVLTVDGGWTAGYARDF